MLLLQGEWWILERKGYTVLGGKSGSPRITYLGKWMPLGVLFALDVLSLTVLQPYAALLKTAITKRGIEGLTLANFHFLFFEFSATQLAMKNSFLRGFTSATQARHAGHVDARGTSVITDTSLVWAVVTRIVALSWPMMSSIFEAPSGYDAGAQQRHRDQAQRLRSQGAWMRPASRPLRS